MRNKHIRVLTIVTACCLFTFSAQAQKKFADNLNGMVNLHSGYNLPEYPFISALTKDYVRSVEVALFKETVGKNKWEQLYNYPDYGLSVFYSTLGNDEVFGRELALTYFFRLYFYSKNRLHLYNRLGIGVSYVSKKFDLEDNFQNVAVGSNVNIHFNARIGARYLLSDKFSLLTGLSFDHFSNGNTSEPNLGINYLTGFGGISYGLGKKGKVQQHKIEEHVKEDRVMLFASIGGKHSRALSSKYFLTSSLSVDFERMLSRKFRFGVGADFFYDSSVKNSLEKESKKHSSSDDFQTGIHISQSLIYNRISITLQEGIYIGLTEKVDDYLIYNRGIIQYQLNDQFAVRLAMKSHLHILDFPEIGVGIKL